MTRARFILSILAIAALLVGCRQKSNDGHAKVDNAGNSNASIADTDVRFATHVAPIIYERCVVCHRDGGSGPFSLLTYNDVSKRGEQIAEVVESGYMPPWLPAESDYEFLGDRRLSTEEVATITSWAKNEMPEGDRSRLPSPPSFSGEWILGTPDLVVEMAESYLHKSADVDEWRNFVLPLDLKEAKYVRTYDVSSDNARAIHHAVIQVDSTDGARRLDQSDLEPGFAGMQNGQISLAGATPDGQFLGWLPGKTPFKGSDDIAWQLKPGDDFVLQLHMPATGKDELVNTRIALYFADQPSKRKPYSMLLSVRDIDIPPGETAYIRELTYTLPVDVDLTGLFPHAHYICEEMHVTCRLPHGQVKQFLHIEKWDFDWQDDYRFAEAVRLPKGSTITMRYRYNNSHSNEQNPFDPPQRITYGEQSTDSMADLILHLVTDTLVDRRQLVGDFRRFEVQQSLNRWQTAIKKEPDNPRHYIVAGEANMLLEQFEQATTLLQRSLQLGDRDPRTFAKLAMCEKKLGRIPQAIASQQQAVRLSPDNIGLRHELAMLCLASGMPVEAEQQYRRIISQEKSDVLANINLGILLGRRNKPEEAEGYFRRAVTTSPHSAKAHINLGINLRSQKRFTEAAECLTRGLELDPENNAAKTALKSVLRELRQR